MRVWLLLLYPIDRKRTAISPPFAHMNIDCIPSLSASEGSLHNFLTTGKTSVYYTELMNEIHEHTDNAMIDAQGRPWVFFSMRYFANKHNLNIVTACRTITMFALFGLIMKASSNAYTKDKTLSFMGNGYKQHEKEDYYGISWYHVPQYTPELLAEAERLAHIWQTSGSSRKSISKAVLIRLYGMALADRAYGNNGVRISRDRKQTERVIEDTVISFIQRDGYVYPAAIEDMFDGSVWAGLRPELIQKYEWRYGPPTADEKRRFHLTCNKWIIRPP